MTKVAHASVRVDYLILYAGGDAYATNLNNIRQV